MKKRELLFRFLLVAIFLVGAIGHIFLGSPPEQEGNMRLTLTVEEASAFLLFALPEAGDTVKVMEKEGRIAAIEQRTPLLIGRKEGVTVTRPATLTETLVFTVSLSAHEKEGRLYLGERMLLIGDTVTIYGENLAFSARLTAFAPFF